MQPGWLSVVIASHAPSPATRHYDTAARGVELGLTSSSPPSGSIDGLPPPAPGPLPLVVCALHAEAVVPPVFGLLAWARRWWGSEGLVWPAPAAASDAGQLVGTSQQVAKLGAKVLLLERMAVPSSLSSSSHANVMPPVVRVLSGEPAVCAGGTRTPVGSPNNLLSSSASNPSLASTAVAAGSDTPGGAPSFSPPAASAGVLYTLRLASGQPCWVIVAGCKTNDRAPVSPAMEDASLNTTTPKRPSLRRHADEEQQERRPPVAAADGPTGSIGGRSQLPTPPDETDGAAEEIVVGVPVAGRSFAHRGFQSSSSFSSSSSALSPFPQADSLPQQQQQRQVELVVLHTHAPACLPLRQLLLASAAQLPASPLAPSSPSSATRHTLQLCSPTSDAAIGMRPPFGAAAAAAAGLASSLSSTPMSAVASRDGGGAASRRDAVLQAAMQCGAVVVGAAPLRHVLLDLPSPGRLPAAPAGAVLVALPPKRSGLLIGSADGQLTASADDASIGATKEPVPAPAATAAAAGEADPGASRPPAAPPLQHCHECGTCRIAVPLSPAAALLDAMRLEAQPLPSAASAAPLPAYRLCCPICERHTFAASASDWMATLLMPSRRVSDGHGAAVCGGPPGQKAMPSCATGGVAGGSHALQGAAVAPMLPSTLASPMLLTGASPPSQQRAFSPAMPAASIAFVSSAAATAAPTLAVEPLLVPAPADAEAVLRCVDPSMAVALSEHSGLRWAVAAIAALVVPVDLSGSALPSSADREDASITKAVMDVMLSMKLLAQRLAV